MYKMKITVCVLYLVSIAIAAPQQQRTQEPVAIVSQENSVNGDGSYQYSYETSDGTKVQESGKQEQVADSQEPANTVDGSFSFVVDGVTYSLTYRSGVNGFEPQADFLPKSPEVPEAIQRSLEYNAAHPEQDNSQE